MRGGRQRVPRTVTALSWASWIVHMGLVGLAGCHTFTVWSSEPEYNLRGHRVTRSRVRLERERRGSAACERGAHLPSASPRGTHSRDVTPRRWPRNSDTAAKPAALPVYIRIVAGVGTENAPCARVRRARDRFARRRGAPSRDAENRHGVPLTSATTRSVMASRWQ